MRTFSIDGSFESRLEDDKKNASSDQKPPRSPRERMSLV